MARTSLRRLPWNDAQRTRLIKLAKQHEILWRPGSNDVEALKRRRMALGQVHRHFVADGFSLDDVKMQWRNLKDIFYKRYELMIKKAQNGEEPSRIRPNWTHFEELRFLASQRAIGEGRTRRTLTYGSIDDVERRIEQGEVEMLEREGGGEEEVEEVEEMGDWMGEEGAEMDNPQQQGMEHVLVKLEGGGAVNEGQQQVQRPKQQEFKDFAGIQPEMDDNFRQLLDESPMGRLSRSIDHRIQQKQQFVRKHNLAIFDGPEQNGSGGIHHHSPFGPSTSSASAAFHLLAESPASSAAAIVDFQQQNPPFVVGKCEGQKKKLALNNGAFVGQRQNIMNNHLDEKKDRFKYFGSYVESALRDLSHQSPELARRLQQSIYSTISAHQMEATNAFD